MFRGEALPRASISIPPLPKKCPFASPVPEKNHGAFCIPPDHVGALRKPVAAGDELNPDKTCLRPTKTPPEIDQMQVVSAAVDTTEEVVGREEGEVSAPIPISLREVVRMTCDVLLMPREHDQAVTGSEPSSIRDALKVCIGEKVDLLPRAVKPVQETQIAGSKVTRYAAVKEGPRQVDRADACGHVPGVAPAVPVRVPEVVGLPGVRRQHDRDRIPAGCAGALNVGGEPDAAVAGVQAGVVETTRPVPDRDRNRVRSTALPASRSSEEPSRALRSWCRSRGLARARARRGKSAGSSCVHRSRSEASRSSQAHNPGG